MTTAASSPSEPPCDPPAPPEPLAGPAKRRRFRRSEAEHPLTAVKLGLLQLLAENRFLDTAQVCYVHGWSEKNARDHLRDLYDLGYVERMPVAGQLVGKAALTAHNVHFPSAAGLRLLKSLGLLPDGAPKRASELRPGGFLAHELRVRDALAWASASALQLGHTVERWDCGPDLDVGGVYADALLCYRLKPSGPGGEHAALVEADMATTGRQRRTASRRRVVGGVIPPDRRAWSTWSLRVARASRLMNL